ARGPARAGRGRLPLRARACGRRRPAARARRALRLRGRAHRRCGRGGRGGGASREFHVGARAARRGARRGGGPGARAPGDRALGRGGGGEAGPRARLSDSEPRPGASRGLPARRRRLRRVGDGRRCAAPGRGVDRQQPDLRGRAAASGRGASARRGHGSVRPHARAGLRGAAARHGALRRDGGARRGDPRGRGAGTPHSREPRMTRRAFGAGRLLALVGVLLVALSLRTPVAALSPILDRVGAEIALDAVVLGLIGAAPPLAFAASGFLAPGLGRRMGLERALVASLAAAVLGHVVRAVAPDAVALTLGTVVTLLGVGVGNVLLPSIVRRYFPDRVGLLTSLYATIMSISTTVPALIAVPVSDAAGWRSSLAVWMLVSLIAAVPWVAMLLQRRD